MNLIFLQSAAGPTPASAYLLCYIPLAAVIIGLITLFVLTDQHAARPYLRFNPFLAASSTQEELEQRAPATGETPAGSLGASPAGGTTVFEGEQGALRQVAQTTVPPPAAPESSMPIEGMPEPQTPSDMGQLSPETQDTLRASKQAPASDDDDQEPPPDQPTYRPRK